MGTGIASESFARSAAVFGPVLELDFDQQLAYYLSALPVARSLRMSYIYVRDGNRGCSC